MYKITFAFINILLILSTTPVLANEGILVIHGRVVNENAIGNARTIIVENSQFVTSTPELNIPEVHLMAKNQFSILFYANSNITARPCENAIVAVTAGEGNFLPLPDGDDHHFYIPELLSFYCVE